MFSINSNEKSNLITTNIIIKRTNLVQNACNSILNPELKRKK